MAGTSQLSQNQKHQVPFSSRQESAGGWLDPLELSKKCFLHLNQITSRNGFVSLVGMMSASVLVAASVLKVNWPRTETEGKTETKQVLLPTGS